MRLPYTQRIVAVDDYLDTDDLEKLYELTYKLGWLSAAERASGWLPDRAANEKAKIEYSLQQLFKRLFPIITQIFDGWLSTHDDDEPLGTDSQLLTYVLLDDPEVMQQVENKVKKINQEGGDILSPKEYLDTTPDEELIAEFLPEGSYLWEELEKLRAYSAKEALRERKIWEEAAAVKNKLENAVDLPIGQQSILYQEALNTMHMHGTMAEHLVAGGVDTLDELSNMDTTQWDRELEAVLGKPLTQIATRLDPDTPEHTISVAEDSFIHFTTKERAEQILETGALLMDPPYPKFGIDAITAISTTHGELVRGTQLTHIEGEPVAILFTTNVPPDVGYVEEVIWHQDVPLTSAQVISVQEAISILNKSDPIDDQDTLNYNAKLRVDAQELPTRVYHATPYAKEIMEEGITLDPEHQSFGTNELSNAYVSTTSLENAKQYAQTLKLLINIVNGNITAEELKELLDTYPNKYEGVEFEGGQTYPSAGDTFQKALEETKGYPEVTTDDLLYAFKNLSWVGHAYGIPAIFGDFPEHLVGKSPDDVGIVELVRAEDMEEYTETYPKVPEDPSRKYTRNTGEDEWRFYDPDDLIPTNLITAFKTYYDWDNQSIEEIVDRWANNNEQLYDKLPHGTYPLNQLLPYREYIWTREDARRNPEEWDELKNSVAEGWDENNPIWIAVGKNGMAKVTEGNHRLSIAEELNNPELNNVPVSFVFYDNVETEQGWKTPEEREQSRQKYNEEKIQEERPEKELTWEEAQQIDELLKDILKI